MTMHGHCIILGQPTKVGGDSFTATNPATGQSLPTTFHHATSADLDRACEAAAQVSTALRKANRAPFLRRIAQNIEALGEVLIERYTAESALPRARAESERARTCQQLRNFAALIEDADWNKPLLHRGDPDRKPTPEPKLFRAYRALGPVAVFGPANFPLAYGVAGGDTASALAAGCPVLVKTHPSHPGVCELIATAIVDAARATDMPAGVFALLIGAADLGRALVEHPAVRAVGFTGSEKGGRAIFDAASRRPTPIPVFAEMSSLNPIVVMPGSFTAGFVDGLVTSVTNGVGQFCTKPGLVLVPAGTDLTRLREKLADVDAQVMLNAPMRSAYVDGIARLATASGVEALLLPDADAGPGGAHATPALLRVAAADFGKSECLHHEVFGPGTLVVEYADVEDIPATLAHLGGQLTASLHGPSDTLVEVLAELAGRVVLDGFPTGVEVTAAMVHGGPYPATTDARFTAVGDRAIDRFLRPVCFQSVANTPTNG